MYKFILEDPTGELEVIVFPREAKNYSDESFKEGEIAYISGTVNKETDDENSTFKLFLTNLEKVDNSTIYSGKSIYINSEDIDEYKFKTICDIINNNNGNRQVYVKSKTDIGTFVYKFAKTTNKKAEDLIQQLMN